MVHAYNPGFRRQRRAMWNIVSKIEKEKEKKTQSAACFIDKGAEAESDIVYFFFSDTVLLCSCQYWGEQFECSSHVIFDLLSVRPGWGLAQLECLTTIHEVLVWVPELQKPGVMAQACNQEEERGRGIRSWKLSSASQV